MKGDFTRSTFDPGKGYSSVRMQQGRVQLDADWNEQIDIQRHYDSALVSDVVGRSGVPDEAAASFEVTADGKGAVHVQGGRIWAGGLLCEMEGAVPVDEAPATDGLYLAYLDVWQRHVTSVEDPSIRESALGGADTATRSQTVARVRYAKVDDAAEPADVEDWTDPGATSGQLAARFRPGGPGPEDPCELPTEAGYTGLENHLYRVEVHRGGDTASGLPPTFKWSRDNGSIVAPWLDASGREVSIPSLGRDSVRGFYDPPYTVELSDDVDDLAGRSGILADVHDHSEGTGGEVILKLLDGDLSSPDPALHPKVRRWDSAETSFLPGEWVDLEHGLQVRFQAGVYRSGDYWLIPARTFIGGFAGDVEWPRNGSGPLDVSPHGVERRAAPLALVWFTGGSVSASAGSAEAIRDCRRTLPRLTRIEASRVRFTPHEECVAIAETDNVEDAINELCIANGGGRREVAYVTFGTSYDSYGNYVGADQDGAKRTVQLPFQPKFVWASAMCHFGDKTLFEQIEGSVTTGFADLTSGIQQRTSGFFLTHKSVSPFSQYHPTQSSSAIAEASFKVSSSFTGYPGERFRIRVFSSSATNVVLELDRALLSGLHVPVVHYRISAYLAIFG